MHAPTPWQFWIDVGGTFTDCLARRPNGQLARHKTLSSGATKGRITSASGTEIVDPARRFDPPNFWVGWNISVLQDVPDEDLKRIRIAEARVVAFDRQSGTLTTDRCLEQAISGRGYELTSGLEAPLVAMRYLTQTPLGDALPAAQIRLGTTRGTNALLTRRGARTGWVTTKGFGDLLKIGYQDRPDLFDLDIHKPDPLHETVIEVDERISHTGDTLVSLDKASIRNQLGACYRDGIRSLAVSLLHSFAFPEHELEVERIAREVGFEEISLSHRLAPVMGLVARGDTTLANAYLNPVLGHYLSQIQQGLAANSTLRLMTSSGGLVDLANFQGKDSILSGPAGGVIGFSAVAQAAGYSSAIGFDMGGTSTDVARFADQLETEYETQKAGVRLVAPMLAIETVAAGGGSICHFDGIRFLVGPDSAGAVPGPACYGRGGPLSVTDINVYLGRIPLDTFPFELDSAAIKQRLREIQSAVERTKHGTLSLEEIALGFLKIANHSMSQAVRTISVAKGEDPREDVLVAFGGAAPQHACAVAQELGIREILIHPDASLLSAVGIGLAPQACHKQQAVYKPLREIKASSLSQTFRGLADEARQQLEQTGVARDSIVERWTLELRYTGTDWPLSIHIDGQQRSQSTVERIEEAFCRAHQHRYGYAHSNRDIEVVAAHLHATSASPWHLDGANAAEERQRKQRAPDSIRSVRVRTAARWVDADYFDREDLEPGVQVTGPAIISQTTSTIVVDEDWSAQLLSNGTLLLVQEDSKSAPSTTEESDPINLEVFRAQFQAIATQMGETLRNTSSSVNVKQRLDFSCAVFDQDGRLVANAPHIPVHLGAMGETVRHCLAQHPDLSPGDVLVTNDPFQGGSHLPDITVVTPVFGEDGDRRFVVASRAHHAEIGGITPGSMPPFSKSLAEEGVLLKCFKLVEAGHSKFNTLRRRLERADFPSRDVDSNLADIAAQIAANRQGERDLRQMDARYGQSIVDAYMGHIRNAAAEQTKRALEHLPDGEYRFVDHLDEGQPIHVAIRISGRQATIDFEGTADVLPNNLNANRAIVTAAVMYVMRCLINEPIPLNDGVLNPVDLIIPPGMLNPPAQSTPEESPAVAGGNVETSQRVVDVLLGAFGLAAASQGTMNNLLFGNRSFGYYETICGGAGATARKAGADAVHTHMTNTRLTDPEVMEHRYPIRLWRFRIRTGSGGTGQFKGGDGIIREIEFLEPLVVSLITQRRGTYPPYGCQGGKPGQLGINRLTRVGQPTKSSRIEPNSKSHRETD